MAPPLFTFRQLAPVGVVLAERGAKLAELLERCGLPATATTELTAPLPKIQSFLDLAASTAGSSLFGLDLADRIPEGAFGVTEFVVRTAPTVQLALEAMAELAPLINPGLDMRHLCDDAGCEIRFAYAANRDVLGDILNEYTVAYIARQFSVVLGRRLPLARAWFAHGRKTGQAEVARRLGCPVDFGAADCGFGVASDEFKKPIPGASPALHDFLLVQARTQLANLGRRDVISQVTRAIELRIGQGDLQVESIATALATSQRTLQRQLGEAGTSYRAILATVRRRRRDELARSGLGEPEIAARLGFADAKTMRRSLDDDD